VLVSAHVCVCVKPTSMTVCIEAAASLCLGRKIILTCLCLRLVHD
jgi:hypothetical protein